MASGSCSSRTIPVAGPVTSTTLSRNKAVTFPEFGAIPEVFPLHQPTAEGAVASRRIFLYSPVCLLPRRLAMLPFALFGGTLLRLQLHSETGDAIFVPN